MKIKNHLPIFTILFTFIIFFNGKKYDELVTQRLTTNVAICLEGEPCGAATSASSSPSAAANSVAKVQLSEGSEHTVKMLNNGAGGQMIFEPAVLKVSLGDTIHFKSTDMAHNSVSIPNMTPSGAKGWTGLMNEDISVTLESEGIYVYQCDPHLMMAMVGVIQVGDATNINEIKQGTENLKKNFIMNTERLDSYLSQL